MKLVMTRLYNGDDHTSGLLRMGDRVFTTLEDEYREVKVPGETRIPPGTYQIKLREQSGMATKYRERYGAGHKGMLWLQDVPNFTYVYIHTGNDDDHTDGCILVGTTMDPEGNFIGGSREAYTAIFPAVIQAIEAGETVEIEIVEQFV